MGPPYTPVLGLLSIVLLMDVPQARSYNIQKRGIFSPHESTLDMARASFDDQYVGCTDVMEAELGQLNQTEYTTNRDYAEAWEAARSQWEDRRKNFALPHGFKDEHAIAILTYTTNSPLHKEFNAAVREAGRSREYYLKNFRFKTLHFLLTKALQILDKETTPKCHRVYRGIRGIRFRSEEKKPVRFGQFTSSSLSNENALQFGQDTLFNIETCYGVNIKNFSFFPLEEEVLIPPFETFKVTNFTKLQNRTVINLHSIDVSSNYNCEFAKERKCKSPKCRFNSAATYARSLASVLPLLSACWGLVMMMDALEISCLLH
nr:GPI-linked NAD(P)(+)--arginine ADP-ribosyltransferase 1 isoform X2 [Geotrypetes seraphini]XP_033806348.1 GPI-linked NAD(P)(+)--arginine ADP-ribosyltransferase 1 isoform X2 [Geotrypetes seraphini]XP_033806349.1 GPI-linked NAD(P)(+)--arginine ADP-ribosyltransferase 1 isoform X2 [Geotrypetes seraphini]